MNFDYMTYYFDNLKNELSELSKNKLNNKIINDILLEIEYILNKKHFFPIVQLNNNYKQLLLKRHGITYILSIKNNQNNEIIISLLSDNNKLDMSYYMTIDLKSLYVTCHNLFFDNNDLHYDITGVNYNSNTAYKDFYIYMSVREVVSFYNIKASDILSDVPSLFWNNFGLKFDYNYKYIMEKENNLIMPFKSLREKEHETFKNDVKYQKVKVL